MEEGVIIFEKLNRDVQKIIVKLFEHELILITRQTKKAFEKIRETTQFHSIKYRYEQLNAFWKKYNIVMAQYRTIINLLERFIHNSPHSLDTTRVSDSINNTEYQSTAPGHTL
jgi:outer membrane PBP1 activator LpoA protein